MFYVVELNETHLLLLSDDYVVRFNKHPFSEN